MLDAYNATPPASAFDPEVLGYFDDGHPLVVVLAFVEKGCVWQAVPAPRHLVAGLGSAGNPREKPLPRPPGRET